MFIKECRINHNKEGHQITGQERNKIKSLMKDFKFEVAGHRPFKEAIITAGGINTKEIGYYKERIKVLQNEPFVKVSTFYFLYIETLRQKFIYLFIV